MLVCLGRAEMARSAFVWVARGGDGPFGVRLGRAEPEERARRRGSFGSRGGGGEETARRRRRGGDGAEERDGAGRSFLRLGRSFVRLGRGGKG